MTVNQYQQAAGIALEFLKRTEIKGSEWRTFGATIQFLEAVAQGQLIVNEIPPPKQPDPIEPPAAAPVPKKNGAAKAEAAT